MLVSVVIAAYKEPKTIAKCLKFICDPKFSKFYGKLEVFQISPDKATLSAGRNYIKTLKNQNLNFIQIEDPQKGKPTALNLGFCKVKGNFLILTDGDVWFEKGALDILIQELQKTSTAAVCGRPVSLNSRKTFMGYVSHLMTTAAHHKRNIELLRIESGFGTQLVRKIEERFFPLSGYMIGLNMLEIKKLGIDLKIPEDCLVDDAYLSHIIFNKGGILSYVPDAIVEAKFPTNLKDYMIQKKRSTGGFLQLWKYGVVKEETNSRSFWQDLSYFWFPFKFAKNLRELIYSLMFYPVRFYLWIMIWFERKVMKKDFVSTWGRVESTK